jgi:hypothetical protein
MVERCTNGTKAKQQQTSVSTVLILPWFYPGFCFSGSGFCFSGSSDKIEPTSEGRTSNNNFDQILHKITVTGGIGGVGAKHSVDRL